MHGKYYNLPVWRIIIKILMLIFFSVECCEIVVAINCQQRDSMLPPKAALKSENLQAARKSGEGQKTSLLHFLILLMKIIYSSGIF